MARIGFIGVGNMGGPMAANLIKAGHVVTVFDLAPAAVAAAKAAGCVPAASAADCVRSQEIVFTMLPAGPQVRAVYGAKGQQGSVIDAVDDGTLPIDCSTIDVQSAREVAAAAGERALGMVDAPVTGGVPGAVAGTLTMIVGGAADAFERAKPYLEVVGGKLVHVGGAGAGQAVKICNNMMLAINMLGVAEAMNLVKALGIEPGVLHEVSTSGSGNSWALANYCPEPGLVPGTPSSNDYRPGFSGAMMAKDTGLALAEGLAHGVALPLGAQVQQLFGLYCANGMGEDDFSGIIRMLRPRARS